jgi:hypothetical protein
LTEERPYLLRRSEMNLMKIKEIAKAKGIKVGNMKKENMKINPARRGEFRLFRHCPYGRMFSDRMSVENGLYRMIPSL